MEFLVWREFINKELEEDLKRHSKQEYYLAQIAMEVYRSNRPKASVRLNRFLLKFHVQKEVDLEAMTDEEYEAARKEAAERSKMYWKMLLGVKT
jgi:hypothetical protein